MGVNNMIGISDKTAYGNASRHGEESVAYSYAEQTRENGKHSERRAYARNDSVYAERVGVGEGESYPAFSHKYGWNDTEIPVSEKSLEIQMKHQNKHHRRLHWLRNGRR